MQTLACSCHIQYQQIYCNYTAIIGNHNAGIACMAGLYKVQLWLIGGNTLLSKQPITGPFLPVQLCQ